MKRWSTVFTGTHYIIHVNKHCKTAITRRHIMLSGKSVNELYQFIINIYNFVFIIYIKWVIKTPNYVLKYKLKRAVQGYFPSMYSYRIYNENVFS